MQSNAQSIKWMDHFVAIVTAKFYYCMLTLDKDTGVINKWSWSFVYKNLTNSVYRMLTISHVSERFIYWYGDIFIDASIADSYGLLLFDPITLKLKLAYRLSGWRKFYGFNIVERNSDAIYWAKFYTFYR